MEDIGIWEQLLQLGSVAFIFVLFLVLFYKLADKYLGLVISQHIETSKANIQTQQQIAGSMEQMNGSLKQLSDSHADSIKEMSMAMRLLADEQEELKEILVEMRRNTDGSGSEA